MPFKESLKNFPLGVNVCNLTEYLFEVEKLFEIKLTYEYPLLSVCKE